MPDDGPRGSAVHPHQRQGARPRRLPRAVAVDQRPVDHFGFSPGPVEPWLPQPADWGEHSAEREAADPNSMLSWYRTLLAHRPLLSGDLTWVDIDLPECLAFERSGVLIVANVGGEAFELPAALVDGRTLILASQPDATPTSCRLIRACGCRRPTDPAASRFDGQPNGEVGRRGADAQLERPLGTHPVVCGDAPRVHRPRVDRHGDRGCAASGYGDLGEADQLLHRFVAAPLARAGTRRVHLHDLKSVSIRRVR